MGATMPTGGSHSQHDVAASVVIPAHNEGATIGRTLRCLLAGSTPDELEIVVVCNGCTDNTATIARSVAPQAIVVELATPSKVAALNEGDRVATRFPRFYVDADVEIGIEAARAVIGVLASGRALCAAPWADYDCSVSSRAVGRYFEIWQQLPYFNQDPMGGVYCLSEPGRARFGKFPDLIADDQFVMRQFDRAERISLPDHSFKVYPPRDVKSLIRTRTRAYRGNRQLAASGLSRFSPTSTQRRGLTHLARKPANWTALATYASITAIAKVRARRVDSQWERDESSRPTSRPDQSGANETSSRPAATHL